jgi:pilus assembly protein CpaB
MKRTGPFLIVSGLVLAGLAAVLVIGIARQATAASRAQIRQVAVVTTTKDIADQIQITADALEVKPFPADFAPPGAFSTTDDLVGKYAQGFLPKGQVVVASQVRLAPAAPLMSDRITPGMVVMWLPMPDVLANSNVLKPGDHVDLLLTAPLTASTEKQAQALSTQTTLQNVEVYRIGDEELGVSSTATLDTGNQAPSTIGSTSSAKTGRQAVGLLLNHQDAVVVKFVKDSGGTLDLVTRSADDPQIVRTDGVTLDVLTEQFRFRVPQLKPAGA